MNYQEYKTAKTIKKQIEYLKTSKRITFIKVDENEASEKLLRNNYINIITPFKHKFAKKNTKQEVIKVNNSHVYENNVDFNEYYAFYIEERKKYPIIVKNILDFDIQFKSIVAYHTLTSFQINNSNDLSLFLDTLKLRFSFLQSRYNAKRINHMNNHIDELKRNIFKYADVYCFFDRMNLGSILTIFTCLNDTIQNKIFSDLKTYNLNYSVDKVPDFIAKVFCLVSIRNCVMHSNSLEILIRFYNPKDHVVR